MVTSCCSSTNQICLGQPDQKMSQPVSRCPDLSEGETHTCTHAHAHTDTCTHRLLVLCFKMEPCVRQSNFLRFFSNGEFCLGNGSHGHRGLHTSVSTCCLLIYDHPSDKAKKTISIKTHIFSWRDS